MSDMDADIEKLRGELGIAYSDFYHEASSITAVGGTGQRVGVD